MENKCPQCSQDMELSQWTNDIRILSCYPCKIKQYYSVIEKRILTDTEINKLGKDWQ